MGAKNSPARGAVRAERSRLSYKDVEPRPITPNGPLRRRRPRRALRPRRGSIHGACTTLSLDKSGRHVAAGYEASALFVWDLSVHAAPARAAVAAHLNGVRDRDVALVLYADSRGDRSITVWRLHWEGAGCSVARAAFDGVSLDSYDRSLLAVSTQGPPRALIVATCRSAARLNLRSATASRRGGMGSPRTTSDADVREIHAIDYDDG